MFFHVTILLALGNALKNKPNYKCQWYLVHSPAQELMMEIQQQLTDAPSTTNTPPLTDNLPMTNPLTTDVSMLNPTDCMRLREEAQGSLLLIVLPAIVAIILIVIVIVAILLCICFLRAHNQKK